ncbi:hypothetical protein [Clostridium sp.]|jgi:hypothetical protein|uniref:hypothetical protein n=1 Tax=Clostridium sp. TaxID=1506 RepID=UPI003EEE795D
MEKTLQTTPKIIIEFDYNAYDEFRRIALAGTRLLINTAYDDIGNNYSVGITSRSKFIVFREFYKEYHNFYVYDCFESMADSGEISPCILFTVMKYL